MNILTTNVQKNNVSVNKFRHIIITTSLGTLKVKSENISSFLDSCSAWRTRRINTKNQSATSQKRGRLKCTPGSAAAATFGPVGTSGTFGTLGTDGTSHSLSMSFPGLMPISGTYIKLGYNEFLLYNNSRYGNEGKWEYLFPVKVKLAKIFTSGTKEEQVLLMEEVRELLSQIYKFSRMYWKSVKQQNLPITIKYPEMVAEIVPHFEDDYLPEFGRRNLWFL